MATRSVRNDTEQPTFLRNLRSTSSSSDIMSASARGLSGPPPPANPRPAYIAPGAAENLVATELDRPAVISDTAVELVNGFLDQILYALLGIARSTSLPALRIAVPKLLKPRLGQAAVSIAEEDLREMADDGNSDFENAQEHTSGPSDFDLELIWNLARLRCMAYARLGDMEDDDAEEYMEQENIREYANQPDVSLNSSSTLFTTSVLEFLGEQALCTAAQTAARRHDRHLAAEGAGADDESAVVIDTVDMMQLGREGPLSRLWRSWRRDTRPLETLASRSNTPATMMSPDLAQHSRSESLGSPNQVIPEEDSPAQIPLPMRDNDIAEIEVPGLAPELEEGSQLGIMSVAEKSGRRPVSMVVVPGGYSTPREPSSPSGPSYQERSPLRPQWHRTRSQSLPTPNQSPLGPNNQDPSYAHLGYDGDQTRLRDGAFEDQGPATPDSARKTSTASHDDHTRAGIISGAVGAIASALGVEAMRSSGKGKGRATDPEYNQQHPRTVADELLGPSNHVAPPADARTSASISEAGDFDNMHIPVQNGHGAIDTLREEDASDPEDLALSDDEIAAQTTPEHRDSGFGVATNSHQRPRGQPSAPSSPSSPKRFNREAAVYDTRMMSPVLQQEENVPPAQTNRSSAMSGTYATADTTQRYSGSHYSQTDRDSSLPIQRPSSHDQTTSAWPAALPLRGSSFEQPQQAPAHMYSASQTSQYSQRSRSASASSNGPLRTQRDTGVLPMIQQRAAFKDESNSPVAGHSRDASRVSQGAGAFAVGAAAAATAGSPESRRQHLRMRSELEQSEDKKKSLEILINSDETLHYTLTPESARPREDRERSLAGARTQTQELADFIRSTGPTSEQQNRPQTATTSRDSMNALRSNPPEKLQTPVEQRAAQLAAAQALAQSRNPLGAARDARPERNTTRDLADYARSTGPQNTDQLPQVVGTRPGTARSAATAGGLRHDGVPVAPVGSPSLESDRTMVNKPSNRLKFQARDARPARDIETSDLIDFIREGPPRKVGEHRIDRHVAPFRTTMDSDDLNALAPPAEINGRSSVGSTHDSSFMTNRSVQDSTNSRTALLENQRPVQKVNGANSAGSGLARQTIPETNGMPPKKRRGPRDPYAIDDSDDEIFQEFREEAPKPKPKPKQRQEESLIDFLRNTAPPPGMTTQPILAAPPRAEPKPDVKRSGSQSRLKDVLTRSNSSSASRNGSAKPSGTAREESPHLTQVGSKMDKYRPTQTTHAAHVERNRQKSQPQRVEPRTATNVRTGTSDLADYLRNSGPAEEQTRPTTGNSKFVSSDVKEQAGFLKFFSKQRGSVKR